MTKFHIFLESGARIELTPSMEQKIYSTIFRLEEKENAVKVEQPKKKKRSGSSWKTWTPEEDAVIGHMVNGDSPSTRNIRAVMPLLQGRTVNSVRVRVYWLRQKKAPAQEIPVTQA